MSTTHLRIYRGPQDDAGSVHSSPNVRPRRSVTVPLSDVLPLLADAIESDRTWLSDFNHDEITISMDLYEVLLAYQHYRRPSA